MKYLNKLKVLCEKFFSRTILGIRLLSGKDLLEDMIELDDSAFQSLSNDPKIFLNMRAKVSGWYMVEVSLEHNSSSFNSVIYFGRVDFSDERKYILPLKNGKVSKRVIYLKKDDKIRFDPIDDVGEFKINKFNLVYLTEKFARKKIIAKISHIEHEETAIIAEEEKLQTYFKVYNKIFDAPREIDSYNEWLNRFEQSPTLNTAIEGPKISIIIPIYRPDLSLFKKCIESVMKQSYQNFELCLIDDYSCDADLTNYIEDMVGKDNRVKYVKNNRNLNISGASNVGLGVSTGKYIALLDHDDELSLDALYYVVRTINNNPCVKFVYTDEDKIDEYENRFSPHFKSGWNPDLLLAQNYISHLGVYQANRMKEIGGFRIGVEGSQDHDLVLRFTHGLKENEIEHIPKILYHWRAVDGSTALDSNQKDYTSKAGLKAVQDFLEHHYPAATVKNGLYPNTYDVRWPLPVIPPSVTLIIPTRDGLDILKPCVERVLEITNYSNFDVLIVDNQSTCIDTLDYLNKIVRRDSRVRVIKWDHEFNYSAINNFAVNYTQSEVIGLINNDVEPINPNWLCELVSHAIRPEIGCVGAKLLYPNNTLQHAGVILGLGGVAGHSHKYFPKESPGYFYRLMLPQNLSAVTGACLLVRRAVYNEVGGLNEDNLKVAFNDVDLCIRVRLAGYRNLWTPYAELYHHESISRGQEDNPEKIARFESEIKYMKETWGHIILNDQYYNINLTKSHENFSIRMI